MSFAIHFKGRLGADPELKVASNGSTVARMRVVTNGRRLVEGNWEDTDTSWWQVVAFGNLAELASEQLRKGQLVTVSGKIKMREWEQDGAKRSAPEVIADDLGVLVVKVKPAAAQDKGWDDAGTPF